MKIVNRNRWNNVCGFAGLLLVTASAIIEHTQGQQWIDPFTVCLTFGIYLSLRSLATYDRDEQEEA